MPVTKAVSAIAELTASGTSATLLCSTANTQVLLINSSNGTGSITTGSTVAVQVKGSGGARWYTLISLPGSMTPASLDQWVVKLPNDAASVQIVYTAPSGPTGYALDAELATSTLS